MQEPDHAAGDYVPAIQELVACAGIPELGCTALRPDCLELARVCDDLLLGGAPGLSLVDRTMATCCRAGLWLLCGDLGTSHSLSQSIDTPEGSYWHGIMHRREGDFDNAKYWFRRVGRHAIAPTLGKQADELARRRDYIAWSQLFPHAAWDALTFVDLCQRASRRTFDGPAPVVREIAYLEWHQLFDYCWRHAVGHTST